MTHRAVVSLLTSAMLFSVSCSILPPVALEPERVAAATAPIAEGEALESAHFARIRRALDRRDTGMTDPERDELAHAIIREAARHQLDTDLVLAVMHVESRFNAFAVSPVGALGLMQIMPATGEELAGRYGVTWRGQQTLFDPLVNVSLGVAYLKELSLRYDSVPTALAAYNWGPGAIDRRLRRGSALPTEYTTLVSDALVDAQRGRRS